MFLSLSQSEGCVNVPEVGVDDGGQEEGELLQPAPVVDKYVEEVVGQPEVGPGDVAARDLAHQVPADVLHALDGGLDHLPGQPEQLLLGRGVHLGVLLQHQLGQVGARVGQPVPRDQVQVPGNDKKRRLNIRPDNKNKRLLGTVFKIEPVRHKIRSQTYIVRSLSAKRTSTELNSIGNT